LGVALGGVAAAGLVAHEDVADSPVDERVVGRQVGAAREAEDDVDALRLQTFHQRIYCAHLTDLLSLLSRTKYRGASPRAGNQVYQRVFGPKRQLPRRPGHDRRAPRARRATA